MISEFALAGFDPDADRKPIGIRKHATIPRRFPTRPSVLLVIGSIPNPDTFIKSTATDSLPSTKVMWKKKQLPMSRGAPCYIHGKTHQHPIEIFRPPFPIGPF